ncbi:MAG: inositol-phosphate phosphatase, partial [Proteobacteria bacterium]|nr:inositol-phosphate phosphatase [Pseudomonadota bacterium]
KSFIREYPFFSTQIALMFQDEIIVGVSNAPEFKEMAWASKGQGAYLNNDKIKINQSYDKTSSCVSTGNIKTLISDNLQSMGKLLLKFSKIRGYGDFYHYHLLAAGKLDLVLESDVNILDIAALSIIVKEAGGLMTDLTGHKINLLSTSVLAGNEMTHKLGLRTLNE